MPTNEVINVAEKAVETAVKNSDKIVKVVWYVAGFGSGSAATFGITKLIDRAKAKKAAKKVNEAVEEAKNVVEVEVKGK